MQGWTTTQLGNYVSIDNDQDITSKKRFARITVKDFNNTVSDFSSSYNINNYFTFADKNNLDVAVIQWSNQPDNQALRFGIRRRDDVTTGVNGIILGGFVVPDDSAQSPYFYAPTCNDLTANNNVVVTTSFLNNNGNNVVHKTGVERIIGPKTFTTAITIDNNFPAAYFLNPNWGEKGTSIASSYNSAIIFNGPTAGTTADKVYGRINVTKDNFGAVSCSISARSNTSDGDDLAFLQLIITPAKEKYAITDCDIIRSSVDNHTLLGTATYRFSQLFAATGTINTSDENQKTAIIDIPEQVLRAWGKVKFQQFQFKDAVAKKGDNARIHMGVIAQRIQDAFQSEGLDARRYGLFCYDEWQAKDWDEKVIDIDEVRGWRTVEVTPAQYNADGEEIVPAKTREEEYIITPEQSHMEHHHEDAGNRYSVRYEECLALECAYQRWRLDQIEARLG